MKRVTRITDGVEVEYTRLDGTVRIESFDYVLAATGRRPNVDGLGLESLGLELDAAGVPGSTRPRCAWATTNLFIAGDASNFIPLLHEAADEGRIAGDNAARLPAVEPGTRRTPLAVVFTDPQIAIVGGGYAKLVPGTFEAGEVSFEDQGRARVMRRNRGHLRVYADRATGRFLGAEMAGPAAEHIGHLLAWAASEQNDGRFDARDALLPPGGRGRAPDGAPGPRREAPITPGHRRVDGVPGQPPGGAVMSVEMKKFGFRIRTRGGSVVDNLTIQGRDRDEAERKLRQVYHHCVVLEARELQESGAGGRLRLRGGDHADRRRGPARRRLTAAARRRPRAARAAQSARAPKNPVASSSSKSAA